PTQHFAIVVDGSGVGGIAAEPGEGERRRSAEVGYWLGEPFWGRGIATEALRAVTDYAFATFDVIRLEAGVFGWNPASARVLEKVGYTLEGRMRQAVGMAGRLHWKAAGVKPPGKIGLAAFDFPTGTLLLTEAGTKRRASLEAVRGEAALRALDPGGIEVLDAGRTAFHAALVEENHTLKR